MTGKYRGSRNKKSIKVGNPEDQLWGIWERKWFEAQVKGLGLDAARKLVQKAIDKRDNLKRNNPKEYKRIYCGL